ncbi:MAG: DUF1049 domain-containing protein [Acidimicrobiia bacterium]
MNLPPPNEPLPERPIVRTRDVNGRLIAFGVVAALAVTFILQNRSRVRTSFLFFHFDSRVWVAMAAAMVLGIVVDRLFAAWWRRRAHQKQQS